MAQRMNRQIRLIARPKGPVKDSDFRVLDPNPEIPLSYYLSGCGVTSLTAYFGLTKIGKPRIGETVLISGAAGSENSDVWAFGRV
jgi:NADPH-dependent curcumin reductase CurA